MKDLLSPDSLTGILDLLEILLVVTALAVTTTDAVKSVIAAYRVQSLLLAATTALAAVIKLLEGKQVTVSLILLIAFLPLVLLIAIRPLLVRATVLRQDQPRREDIQVLLAGMFAWIVERFSWNEPVRRRLKAYRQLEADAEDAWRDRHAPTRSQSFLLVFPALLLLAFLAAFSISPPNFERTERIGLAVSLALHLIGLYNMTLPQRDIISQTVGLLLMDHGLYLAVVKIVAIPVPATIFVLSLYFYTAITVFILLILLPQLRQQVRSIDRAEIKRTSPLVDAYKVKSDDASQ